MTVLFSICDRNVDDLMYFIYYLNAQMTKLFWYHLTWILKRWVVLQSKGLFGYKNSWQWILTVGNFSLIKGIPGILRNSHFKSCKTWNSKCKLSGGICNEIWHRLASPIDTHNFEVQLMAPGKNFLSSILHLPSSSVFFLFPLPLVEFGGMFLSWGLMDGSHGTFIQKEK